MDISKYCPKDCIQTKIDNLNKDNLNIDAELSLVLGGGYSYRFASFIANENIQYGNANMSDKVIAYAKLQKDINNLNIVYWASRLN